VYKNEDFVDRVVISESNKSQIVSKII